MAIPRSTAKSGRYPGAGDPLDTMFVGEHDKGGIELFPGFPWTTYKRLYGFHASGSYLAADFTERKTGTGATIAMAAAGLTFTSGSAASTDDAQAQAVRSFTPAAGKMAVAFARLEIDDITHPLFAFGFSNTVTDYGAGEGTDNAMFLMAAGAATVVGRSKDGATGSSTATLFSMAAGIAVDFCVLIDGVSAVEYRWKLATASKWNVTRKTTNLPAAAQRLTLALGSGESASNNVIVHRWGFYAEHTNVI